MVYELFAFVFTCFLTVVFNGGHLSTVGTYNVHATMYFQPLSATVNVSLLPCAHLDVSQQQLLQSLFPVCASYWHSDYPWLKEKV
jgi:hypothetical protein